MRILAIDPGFERLGIAVVEKANPKELLLASDCLRTSSKDLFPERLGQLGGEIEKWIKQWQPNAVALEKLFLTNNQKTAMQIAEVRGMIIYIAASKGLPIIEKTPLEIKQTITGFGRADKTQVALMVTKLVAMPPEKTGKILDDEYDAIALGLTALATSPVDLRRVIPKTQPKPLLKNSRDAKK